MGMVVHSGNDSLMYTVGTWAFDILEVVLDKSKISSDYEDVSTENIFFEKVS